MEFCILRLTEQTVMLRTDNPRMPHLSVITAYHTDCCRRGHFLDAYVGVKMLVCACAFVHVWCLTQVMLDEAPTVDCESWIGSKKMCVLSLCQLHSTLLLFTEDSLC